MLLIRRLSNEARLFQSFQAIGKNVGGNAFGRILQLSIGHITPDKSRTTSNDHLSPTRSSVHATAQGKRRKPRASVFGFILFGFLLEQRFRKAGTEVAGRRLDARLCELSLFPIIFANLKTS